MMPIDVLILTALQDELDGVLALGSDWEEHRDLSGFRYFTRTCAGARGEFSLAAAWIGEMGGRAAVIRGQQLLSELSPSCLAMCGICAGYSEKVSLGDVIVADQLFVWDEGKRIAEPGKPQVFYHDLRTFDLEAVWSMEASYLAKEIDLAALSRRRPPSIESQKRWLLHAILAFEEGRGPSPSAQDHPTRRMDCPDYSGLLKKMLADGMIVREKQALRLTEKGRDWVDEDLIMYPDGFPKDPAMRVHVGAMASVSAVVEDPDIFKEMRKIVRGTIGLEMEGASLAELAARFSKKVLLVKAVQDFADGSKNDMFRIWGCRASAEVLFVFLEKHFAPEREDVRRDTVHERDHFPVDRENPFLLRVERVASLRFPNARITRHSAEPPFAGVLELETDAGEFYDLRLVCGLDRPLTEELFGLFLTRVERSFRERHPMVRSTLVHLGDRVSKAFRDDAFRRGVSLTTFEAYQGLFDLRPYLEWQTARLERDPVYPPAIYVDQPATYETPGSRVPQKVDDALRFLWELLESQDQRRFSLVLGEFGAGKTFLLKALCRRMVTEKHRVWPVLVEMEKLEKTHDLSTLLAAHFAQADVQGYNFKAFRYMLEEGRIALLFDGFDELADRVTYETVHAHFDTVLSAAQGGSAKVVLSSRRQHFLSESRVKLELTRRAEVIPGFHLMMLLPFEERQIRRYLENVLLDSHAADERYALIHDIKDLLGLSHNPRMLGFIARIPEATLRAAKLREGEITAARLYELLVNDWLDFEHKRSLRISTRKGISREALGKGMVVLAMSMWHAKQKTVEIEQIRDVLAKAMADLKEPVTDPELVAHLFGSGSLLVRDGEARFSFVHRSVMEWLVAREAAEELSRKGESAALGADEMSPLMADFFHLMAGREKAVAWAKGKRFGVEQNVVATNAALVLQRLGESLADLNFAGQDLRGRDFSGVDWRGADLRGADLTGATLVGADLTGANLTGARCSRANFSRAKLVGARLGSVALRFAKCVRVDVSGSVGLESADLWASNWAGAVGVAEEVVEGLEGVGGAGPVVKEGVGGWDAAWDMCLCVAFDPTGEILAAGYRDGAVSLFDTVSGERLRTLAGHKRAVNSIAFAPDGKTLGSGSDDHTLRLWDLATGRSVGFLEGHTDSVLSVSFSPDGKTLASGSEDGTIRVWDLGAGRFARVLEGHTSWVLCVAFGPDGKTLASGSSDQTIGVWDLATGRSARFLKGHTKMVNSVAFGLDGKTLASGSSDNTIRVWDLGSGRSTRFLEGHTKSVIDVTFGQDGKTLVSGSFDNTIRFWELISGRSARVLQGHTYSLNSLAVGPDGKMLAWGSYDYTIGVWDLATGRSARVIEGHTNPVRSVAFGPDGKMLASGSSDHTIRLWDLGNGSVARILEGHTHRVRSVAFGPDGKTLASGSYDNTVCVWDLASGLLARVLEGHSNRVNSVALGPDGKTLASGSDDNTVRLWDLGSSRSPRVLEGHTRPILSVAFAPDGKTLASGSDDSTIRLWDVGSGRSARILEGHTNRVRSVAFGPDGKTLASGSYDNTIRLWDIDGDRSIRVLEGHSNRVRSVAFGPDGKMLASGSYDSTIRLWDIEGGRSIRVLEGHTNAVLSVAFAPDGKILASGSDDNTIRLWDIATGTNLAILLATPNGWVAFTPDGRYKYVGDVSGSFWHTVGLCRFEPGELDEFLPTIRLPDDYTFLP